MPRRPSKKLIIVLCAALVLALIGVSTGIIKLPFSSKDSSAISASDENATSLTLTPSNDMSYTNLSKAVDILTERLTNWFGEDGYALDTKDGTISLVVPTDGFAPLSLRDGLYRYFIRPTELYACDAKHAGTFFEAEKDAFHIERKTIASVDLVDGYPDFVTAPANNSNVADYTSLVLTLTDDAWKSFEPLLKSWNNEFVLMLDLGNNPLYGYSDVAINEKSHSIAILPLSADPSFESEYKGDVVGDKTLAALAFALTHEALPDNLYPTFQNRINWHAYDTRYELRNAVSADKVGTQTTPIFVNYRTYGSGAEDGPTQGEVMDLIQGLGTRLDSMCTPYAIGKNTSKENSLAVLLPTSHVGSPIGALLTYESSGFGVTLDSHSFDIDSIELRDPDHADSLVCTVAKDDVESFSVVQKSAKPDDTIYLTILSHPLLEAHLSDVRPDGTITFTATCFNNEEDMSWLFRLINAVYANPPLTSDLSISYNIGSTDDDTLREYGIAYKRQLQELLDVVHEICPNATGYEEGSFANIFLKLDVDETLPTKSAEAIEKIYERMNFENSPFEYVHLFLCSTRMGERANALFSKSSISNDNPSVSFSGLFEGGRLDRYRDEFISLINKSEVLQKLVDPENPPFALSESPS